MKNLVGWLVLAVCACGAEPAKEPARVLTEASQQALSGVTVDPADEMKGTVVFSPIPAELADVAVGEVVILPPTKPMAYSGLMYRIDALERTADTLTIHGTQPPLTDMIKEGTFDQTIDITETDIDMERTMASAIPGPTALEAGFGPRPLPTFRINWPRIDFSDNSFLCDGMAFCELSGHITLPHPQFAFRMDFDRDGLQHTRFSVTIDAEVAIDMRGRVAQSLGKSFTITEVYVNPIFFYLGIPIYLQPRIKFKVGARASVLFDATTAGFEGGAHIVGGFDDVRGQPRRSLNEATPHGSGYANGLTQSALLADVYSRVEAGCYFYNVAGPYQYFEQGPRIDVATPRHPNVKVGYRIATGAGGRVDLFWPGLLNLLDFEFAIFDMNFGFYESPNSPPAITTFAPATVSVEPTDNVAFSIDGYDSEDGPVTDAMVAWRSDRDGVFGHAKNVAHQFFAGGPGARLVHGIVTDSDGVPAERTVNVTVIGAKPQIQIVSPSILTVYTNVAVPVGATVTSPYYPAGDLCTATGSILRWDSSVPADTVNPAAQSGCSGAITFHTPGTRTLTFNATDRWNQTHASQITIQVIDPPSCAVSIDSLDGTNVTNTGGVQSVRLHATISPLCPGGYPNWYIHSTANGGEHSKLFAPTDDITFNPTTDLGDDGFLLVKVGDTAPQSVTVDFSYDWDDKMGDVGHVMPVAPITLTYTWH